MSEASLARAGIWRRRSAWAERLRHFAARNRQAWPAVAIIVATLIAYHFTLASLFDFLRLDTPLAYLPLLPLFCIGIGVVTARRYEYGTRPIRDRQIDLLVGVPMVGVALLLITLAPVIASTYYWTDRADVLSLALFAAGATIAGYGVTWFWRLKASFIFLVLMWPALYLHLLAGVMQRFTDATNAALAQIVHWLPLGVRLGGQSGLLIVSQPHAAPLQVAVGSACSGANSVLGFALIGGAVLTTMRGGRLRASLWWVAGLALAFGLNIARLVSILALASVGHPEFALGGYHAVIGLVLFGIAVTLMLFVLPWFGLRSKEAPTASGSSTQHPAPGAARLRRRVVVVVAVLAVTGLTALADQALQPYAAFEDGSGSPTVKPFTLAAAPPGWTVSELTRYPWVTQYFGDKSTWYRYMVTRPGGGGVAFADMVLTDDKGSLDTYNLQNCFLFHNYDIRTSQRVDLGNGVYGLLLNYSDPATHTRWATVSWAWPVVNKGDTYYERIALTASPLQRSPLDAPSFQPSGGFQDIFLDLLNGVAGGRYDASAAQMYGNVDTALRGDAIALVRSHAMAARG